MKVKRDDTQNAKYAKENTKENSTTKLNTKDDDNENMRSNEDNGKKGPNSMIKNVDGTWISPYQNDSA